MTSGVSDKEDFRAENEAGDKGEDGVAGASVRVDQLMTRLRASNQGSPRSTGESERTVTLNETWHERSPRVTVRGVVSSVMPWVVHPPLSNQWAYAGAGDAVNVGVRTDDRLSCP